MKKWYPDRVYNVPTPPWPRPDSIYTCIPGRLPRQSYPPQKGVVKLPKDDELSLYLQAVAADEFWDEWDWCWSRLAYLPRWDLQGIWNCPPGWLTPHAFLAWATWHLTVAYGWLSRLYRAMRHSHSPEDLLTNPVPINPIYQFLDRGQLDYCRKRVSGALKQLHAGQSAYLPTNEKVIYPANGLMAFMQYIEADHNLQESVVNFEWHNSRARNKAEFFVAETVPTLRVAAVNLQRHLGEAGWSE